MPDAAILHLASGSPRRREILACLGVRFTWQAVDVDETPGCNEAADKLAPRLALAKARESRLLRAREPVIIGADTVVAIGDRHFGKPGSLEEAVFMLSQLSGREHTVYTAVAMSTDQGDQLALSQTRVTMRIIGEDEAALYWRSGEPAGKAGAYAIQGIGGTFVEALSGSYTGVVGLPVYETSGLLKNAGIDLLHLQRDMVPGS